VGADAAFRQPNDYPNGIIARGLLDITKPAVGRYFPGHRAASSRGDRARDFYVAGTGRLPASDFSLDNQLEPGALEMVCLDAYFGCRTLI
jgi:hypothetical protein